MPDVPTHPERDREGDVLPEGGSYTGSIHDTGEPDKPDDDALEQETSQGETPAEPFRATDGGEEKPFWDRGLRKYHIVLGILAALSCVSLLAAFSCVSDSSNDGPALVSYGRFLFQSGRFARFSDVSAIPDHDRPGAIHHQWLVEVVGYGAWAVLGEYGNWVLFFLNGLVIAVSFWSISRKRVPSWFAAGILLLTLVAIQYRFRLRGDCFSLGFLSVFIALLHHAEQTDRYRCLYWLIPVQIAWMNTHPFGVFGSALVLLFTVERVVRWWAVDRKEKIPFRSVLPLLAVAGMVGVASMATPYGPRLPGLAFTTSRSAEFLAICTSIREFQPLFSIRVTDNIRAFYALVPIFGLCVGGFLVNRRGWLLLFSLALGYLTIRYFRFMGFASLAGAAAILVYFPDVTAWLKNAWPASMRTGRILGAIGAMGVVLAGGLAVIDTATGNFYSRNRSPQAFGKTRVNRRFPWRAVEFVTEKGLTADWHCNFDIGSFLSLHLPRGSRVTIDTQFLYAYDYYFQYMRLMNGEEDIDPFLQKYGVTALFIKHNAPDSFLILRDKIADPDWALVFLDEMSALFLKRCAEHGELMDEYKVDLVKGEPDRFISKREKGNPFAEINMAHFFFKIGLRFRAKPLYMSALEKKPDFAFSWNNLGLILADEQNWKGALHCFSQALTFQPKMLPARRNLARLLASGVFDKKDPDAVRALQLLK